jgi:soluble lytic murein transglycosylase-like protein
MNKAMITMTVALGALQLGGCKRKQETTSPQSLVIEREVPEKIRPIWEHIKAQSKSHGMPEELLKAIITVESGGDPNNEASRFEPRVEAKAKNRAKATSWGVMQVIPYFHLGKGKSCDGIAETWSDLVGRKNIETNIKCGLAALSSCWVKQKAESESERLKKSLDCYNGDPTGTYSKKILNQFAEYMLDGKQLFRK